jgi:protein-L-isoaspartate(D-aspartate) O-methyltransferase
VRAAILRKELVDRLVASGWIRSPAIEAAFRAVPRDLFLPGLSLEAVYRDEAIPTSRVEGQVVSSSTQPAMMAEMLEQLDLQPGQHVLEVGAGTGYNAAVMGQIVGSAGHVTSIEIDEALAAAAGEHLAAAGVGNVEVIAGDGYLGWPHRAPFDRIIVTAATTSIAPAWGEQLRVGGRLVAPVHLGITQCSIAFRRDGVGLVALSVVPCGFVPLRRAGAG